MEKKCKYLTWASILAAVVLLLPILYLTFVNRASGDDYGYGVYTRAAWLSTHSLIEVGKAVWRTVKQFYVGWQGTWFSIALFSLQPEVFHDGAYVIVAILMLALWIGSTFYLFRQVLCRYMGFGKWSYRFITICFLVIGIEFIPRPKSAIFWFNGCAHYMIPFAMCQVTAAWLMRYCTTYKKKILGGGIIPFMALLGGANYQAALLVLISAVYIGAAAWLLQKDRRVFLLGIPIGLELIGLAVSFAAPGNKVRAGEDFGFSALAALQTIGRSFVCGLQDIGGYAKDRPLILVGLFFLFGVLVAACRTREKGASFRHPVLLALMLFCLYSAMQAPAIYAGVDVSGGVPNTNYQVFLLTAAGILLILAQVTTAHGLWDRIPAGLLRGIVIAGIVFCVLSALVWRSSIKRSTSYVCLEYITSGQAADYREQMKLQTRLLEDAGTTDVVVPGINDIQGPLMHMPVTEDKEAWTNTVTAQFYGKNSVVSMERPKWLELYGE